MNNPLQSSVLALVLYLAIPAGYAGDLDDIYRLAESNDPDIRQARASRLALLEAKPQSRAQLFPTINLNADTTDNSRKVENSSFFPSVDEGFNSNSYTLSITQPLYRQELLVGLKQADATVSKAETDYRAVQQELIVRVAERYFDVLAEIDNLEFARAEKNAVSRQLEQAKQRFEVGLIAITDVHEAQARYDLTVAQEILADNRLANSHGALQEITGQYHTRLAPLTGEIPLITPEPADIGQWAQKARENNLQIASARHAMEIARQEIRLQRAGHFPTLDIVATHRNSVSHSLTGNETTSDTIALELNVPIFQGGLVNSRVREARHRFVEASELLIGQQRAVTRQTRDAYLGVVAGISRIRALKQAVVSNRSALDATQAGFEVGTRTIVDVLTVQQELFRAQRDLARSRYDYILDTLRLKQAAGILEPADLEKVNRWLGGSTE